MAALSKAEIQQKLKEAPGWSHQGKSLHKKFTLKSFMPVINLVNQIAAVAEQQQHHPDITINYNILTIALSTHSEGGVTQKDFELARQIDRLASEQS